MHYTFTMEKGEFWWGGTSESGCAEPFDNTSEFSEDFRIVSHNQTMPMFLSNHGRCIWSETPFAVEMKSGTFTFEGEGISIESFGTTLRDAYRGAQKKYFPPCGKKLPDVFFSIPQYNTWMQHTYNPTQEKVLQYAKDIIANGFSPGILIIDEGWQKEYGVWTFDELKFPDPKGMVEELHEMGFRVMLWVVPFVRPDGEAFIKKIYDWFNPETYNEMFLRNENGKIAITNWWNGYSAVLDMTKACDRDFMEKQLSHLMQVYHIDGFKFDGGTLQNYTDALAINGPLDRCHTPAERNIAWNEFGARYSFHEYKDTFKGGGKRTIQRLQDRNHSWDENGLNTLIPNAILQGLLGHPFLCPDMIGGGSWIHRDLNRPIDEELFVRMAQCAAFFPMMQFSWAPWEAVCEENVNRIREAHNLHIQYAPKMQQLIETAYETGEPILRSLAYNYPDGGYETVKDQFMLGELFLVAPVVMKGEKEKTVFLPPGTWKGFDGEMYKGAETLKVSVTLDTLPYFVLQE